MSISPIAPSRAWFAPLIPNPMSDVQDEGDLRSILLIIYGLFVLATFNGATAIVGVVLAYIKRDAARGTMWEGHFRNLIHVFWIALVVAIVAISILIEAFCGL